MLMFSTTNLNLHRHEGLNPQEVGTEAWFVCLPQISFPWKVTGCICRHQTGVAGGNVRTLLITPEIPSLPCTFSSCSSPGFSAWRGHPALPLQSKDKNTLLHFTWENPDVWYEQDLFLSTAKLYWLAPMEHFYCVEIAFFCGNDHSQKEQDSPWGSLDYSHPRGQGALTGSPNSGWSFIAHKYVVDTSLS